MVEGSVSQRHRFGVRVREHLDMREGGEGESGLASREGGKGEMDSHGRGASFFNNRVRKLER